MFDGFSERLTLKFSSHWDIGILATLRNRRRAFRAPVWAIGDSFCMKMTKPVRHRSEKPVRRKTSVRERHTFELQSTSFLSTTKNTTPSERSSTMYQRGNFILLSLLNCNFCFT